ncbi:hypothetical protein AB0K89_25805 [Streptomyces cinnamoneus]|uniref:hypothetical protein n=1 Tax=Streptomyces cinnamoneus TaxID=53446 RepID=UPI00341C9C19
MRHPLHVLGSPVLAALLALAAPPPAARASTGTFVYHVRPGTERHALAEPIEGQCYAVGYAQGVTGNETDLNAYLYDTPDCHGAAAYFPAGFYGVQSFQSVAFLH